MTQGLSTKLQDLESWDKLYDMLSLDVKSPFFSSDYYRSYGTLTDGDYECFWLYLDDKNFLLYPYIISSVNSLGYDLAYDVHDVCGAYGYNGPIGNVQDLSLIVAFNNQLKEYFADRRVVTEFVRYCPLINNRVYHSYTDQSHVLDNVYIDLGMGLDTVWNDSFEYSVRKTVTKGIAYRLSTEIYTGKRLTVSEIEIFHTIYSSTMERNSADDFYHFEMSFFLRLLEQMPNKLLLAITFLDQIPISTELILLDGIIAYGFLGGTLSEYYKFKANTYQRWEILKYLHANGVRKYSMGGGSKRFDSIYSFKHRFAKHCDNPFYIGTHIHDQKQYQIITDQWNRRIYNSPLSFLVSDTKIRRYRTVPEGKSVHR